MQFRRLSEDLDAQIATYKRQRWERPVLRGEAGEGNAALTAQQALVGFTGLPDHERDALAAQLYYGLPLSAAQITLVDQYAEMIGKLRAATQLGWAMTELPVEQGENARVPPDPAHGRRSAARARPRHALERRTIVWRSPPTWCASGRTWCPARRSRPPASRCASRALRRRCFRTALRPPGPDAVLRAARELHELATHAPPSVRRHRARRYRWRRCGCARWRRCPTPAASRH